MKRVWQLVLMVGAAMALFAACGGGDSPDSESVSAAESNAAEAPANDAGSDSSDSAQDEAATAASSGGGESLDEILGAAANIVRRTGFGGPQAAAGFNDAEALEQQRLIQQ